MNLGLPVSGAPLETLHHRLVVKTEKRASGERVDVEERERERRGKEMEGEGREIGRFDGSLVSAVRVSTDAHHRRCAVLMGP